MSAIGGTRGRGQVTTAGTLTRLPTTPSGTEEEREVPVYA